VPVSIGHLVIGHWSLKTWCAGARGTRFSNG